jgi:hypothetical protein
MPIPLGAVPGFVTRQALTYVPGFEIGRRHLHEGDRLLQAWNF